MILEPACHFLFIFVMVFALNQNNLTKVGLKRSWLFILVLHPLHKTLSPSLIPYFIKEFIKYFSTIGFKRSKDVRRTSYAGETYTAHLQPGNNSWKFFFELWDQSQNLIFLTLGLVPDLCWDLLFSPRILMKLSQNLQMDIVSNQIMSNWTKPTLNLLYTSQNKSDLDETFTEPSDGHCLKPDQTKSYQTKPTLNLKFSQKLLMNFVSNQTNQS